MSFDLMIPVMAEYGSSGVWALTKNPSGLFRHGMIEHSQLNMPSKLGERFEQWIHEYEEKNLNNTLNTDRFNAEGLELARLLKAFLGPDTYVEYQGESKDGGLLKSVIIE